MGKENDIQKLRKKQLKEKTDFVSPAGDYTQTENWKKYEKIQNLPMFKNKISKASDGRRIHIGWAQPTFLKKIKGLPKKEVESLLKKKAIYNKLNMKSMHYKRKAYLEVNKIKEAGGRKSVLDIKKAEILELFGRMFKLKEVHKIVVEDWDLQVTITTLEKYRKKHEEIINQKIEEFKRDYSDIRLSIKKSRLEELVWLYMKRKRIYEGTSNRDDHKLLLQTIEQIRKESEGEQIRINGKIEFEQEKTIQHHLMTEAFKFLSIKQLVLSRIAAKFRRNPLMLQKAIADSYYNKFLLSPVENQHPGYPTNDTYDFEKVVQLAQIREQEEKQKLITIPEVKNEEKVNDIKQQLIERLKQLSGDVNAKKNTRFFEDEIEDISYE